MSQLTLSTIQKHCLKACLDFSMDGILSEAVRKNTTKNVGLLYSPEGGELRDGFTDGDARGLQEIFKSVRRIAQGDNSEAVSHLHKQIEDYNVVWEVTQSRGQLSLELKNKVDDFLDGLAERLPTEGKAEQPALIPFSNLQKSVFQFAIGSMGFFFTAKKDDGEPYFYLESAAKDLSSNYIDNKLQSNMREGVLYLHQYLLNGDLVALNKFFVQTMPKMSHMHTNPYFLKKENFGMYEERYNYTQHEMLFSYQKFMQDLVSVYEGAEQVELSDVNMQNMQTTLHKLILEMNGKDIKVQDKKCFIHGDIAALIGEDDNFATNFPKYSCLGADEMNLLKSDQIQIPVNGYKFFKQILLGDLLQSLHKLATSVNDKEENKIQENLLTVQYMGQQLNYSESHKLRNIGMGAMLLCGSISTVTGVGLLFMSNPFGLAAIAIGVTALSVGIGLKLFQPSSDVEKLGAAV